MCLVKKAAPAIVNILCPYILRVEKQAPHISGVENCSLLFNSFLLPTELTSVGMLMHCLCIGGTTDCVAGEGETWVAIHRCKDMKIIKNTGEKVLDRLGDPSTFLH